ncbi:hypothetical protein LDFHOB_04360 [Candidatus Electronema aureum]
MIAKPVSPKDTPPVPPEKTDAEPEDLPVPMAKESGVSSKRMALLSASPVNDEQNWKPYLDELKKIAFPIDHFILSRDNPFNLKGYDYVLILSKVIKNRLLIGNIDL